MVSGAHPLKSLVVSDTRLGDGTLEDLSETIVCQTGRCVLDEEKQKDLDMMAAWRLGVIMSTWPHGDRGPSPGEAHYRPWDVDSLYRFDSRRGR